MTFPMIFLAAWFFGRVFDRLKLTDQRVRGIAEDIRNVAKLPSPLGILLEERNVFSRTDMVN